MHEYWTSLSSYLKVMVYQLIRNTFLPCSSYVKGCYVAHVVSIIQQLKIMQINDITKSIYRIYIGVIRWSNLFGLFCGRFINQYFHASTKNN